MDMQFPGTKVKYLNMARKEKPLKNIFSQDPVLGLKMCGRICYVKKRGFENNCKEPTVKTMSP